MLLVFHTTTSFPRGELLQTYSYFHRKYSADIIQRVHASTTRTGHSTFHGVESPIFSYSFIEKEILFRHFFVNSYSVEQTPAWMLPWTLQSWPSQVMGQSLFIIFLLITIYFYIHLNSINLYSIFNLIVGKIVYIFAIYITFRHWVR